MTTDQWHVSVLIPARDEENLLPRCLQSVLEARDALGGVATCDVVVTVDRSMDATLAIAHRMLAGAGIVIRSKAGIVGLARAMAARAALRRRKQRTARIWLANTDADCWVPPNWLSDQLQLAESGVEAAAGIVDVDSFAEHDAGRDLSVFGRFRLRAASFGLTGRPSNYVEWIAMTSTRMWVGQRLRQTGCRISN